jgi:16S rRNA (uracil1498-N3)-methyltransferase
MRDWGEFVYAPPAAKSADRIVLPEDEAHHLFRVRRVSTSQQVYVTDGRGMVYRCQVEDNRELTILESLPKYNELPRDMALLCGVLKGDMNRTVLDKATQLGTRRIIFFHAERSEGRLAEEKLERLQRVALNAIKQCGRARLPEISIVKNIESALTLLPPPCTIYLAHPDATGGNEPSAESSPIALIIGPEGGLTDREVQSVVERGAIALSLGQRRLRAETAVCTGLAALLTRMGECRVIR